MTPAQTKKTKRLARAIGKMNKAKFACASARSELRYATDDNGGWATPAEEKKLRLKARRACEKASRADVAFRSVMRAH